MQIIYGAKFFDLYDTFPVCKLQVSFMPSKFMTTSRRELIHASIVSKLLFRRTW